MDSQDKKFNYKIILAALAAVIIVILIAFYYSHSQSEAKVSFLEQEKGILVRDLMLMRADVDRLSTLNEVNDIELQDSRFRVQQLLDSVGKLNFTVGRLREYKTELRRLEAKSDSLKLKNNYLSYNNNILSNKYKETKSEVELLKANSTSLAQAEAAQRRQILELNQRLKTKTYLEMDFSEGRGYRIKSDRPVGTNKASTIEKLRGCVTVLKADIGTNPEKILYFQFLDPKKQIIGDDKTTVTVNGNVYSKRVKFIFTGEQSNICDFISVAEGSLKDGIYTLNVFEDERLITSSQFQLK